MNQLFSFERTKFSKIIKYGDYSKKDPPVPMPNTAVKLLCAEDSEGFPLVKAGRCRSFLHPWLNWIEHLTSDQAVGGSNPSGCVANIVM